MKHSTVLSVAILVCLACTAPSAQATEVGAESTSGTETASWMGSAASQAPDATARRCPATLEEPAPAKLPASCSFGAPPCSYNGQCVLWCSPLGGLCLSGCCACKP